MIRLLLIIPTLDRCGAEKQLALLATHLPRSRFEVHVCALTRGGPWRAELEAAGVPVEVIGKRGKLDPLAYWRLRRHIQRLRPQIVHTWLFAANSYGRQAALAARVPHVLASERCVDRWKMPYQFAIDRYLARRTERITVNSEGVRRFYELHAIPNEKLVVIPNGISVPAVSEASSNGGVREELGLAPETKLVGCVNRLWPQKRVKDLIWAAHLLEVARGDTRLLVIGDGPQRWRLERYARLVLDDPATVRFLGERDDVSTLLPQLDAFWLGSGYEGMSNALMEALAHGLPCVAGNLPGNRELVEHTRHGALVPVGDRAAFARWTHKFFEEPAWAEELGQAARSRMAAEFSVERMVERHAALYEQVAT